MFENFQLAVLLFRFYTVFPVGDQECAFQDLFAVRIFFIEGGCCALFLKNPAVAELDFQDSPVDGGLGRVLFALEGLGVYDCSGSKRQKGTAPYSP